MEALRIAHSVQDLIVDNKIDILGLCETGLKPDEFLALNEATPPNYIGAQVYREVKKGGGVALISNSKLNLKPKNIYTVYSDPLRCSRSAPQLPTSEMSSRLFRFSSFAVVYRPPGPY